MTQTPLVSKGRSVNGIWDQTGKLKLMAPGLNLPEPKGIDSFCQAISPNRSPRTLSELFRNYRDVLRASLS
jgi:hypothetical protein